MFLKSLNQTTMKAITYVPSVRLAHFAIRGVVCRAHELTLAGHEVFAVLTHIDAYSPDDDDEDDEEDTTDPDEDGGGEGEDTSGSLGEEKPAEKRASTDGTGTGFDREAMPGIISLW